MLAVEEKRNESFTLTDIHYNMLCRIIYDTAGIHLGDNKKELIHARLCKIMRKRNINGFRDYLNILKNDETEDELIGLLDAISTNVTHFFREEKHFDFLVQHLPERGFNGNLRIWSAGCSSGEEPYSIAITLLEHIVKSLSPAAFILATDISTKVLKRAVTGIYPLKAADKVDQVIIKKYFLKGKGSAEGMIRLKKEIVNMVTFQRLNLIEPFPFRQEFDIIFCRNVMIYFDSATRKNTVQKFYETLNPGGYLIIGHSESLNGIQHSFNYIQPTIYRK